MDQNLVVIVYFALITLWRVKNSFKFEEYMEKQKEYNYERYKKTLLALDKLSNSEVYFVILMLFMASVFIILNNILFISILGFEDNNLVTMLTIFTFIGISIHNFHHKFKYLDKIKAANNGVIK